VFGVLADKDVEAMAASLAPFFTRAVTATPPHPVRARRASESAAALARSGVEAAAHETVAEAVRHARALLSQDGWLVVTGSLFTVGAAMEELGDAARVIHPARSG
jgi:dihydrofolate synthase/folylpolyglutamate synthase